MAKDESKILEEGLGISALFPFSIHNSASRGVMTLNQASLSIALDNPKKPIVFTGLEDSATDMLSNIKLRCEFKPLAVVDKYRSDSLTGVDLKMGSTLIYHDLDNDVLDAVYIPKHQQTHTKFGFEHEHTDLMKNLEPDVVYPPGQLTTTNSEIDGEYAFGTPANILLANFNEAAEDAIIVREGFLDSLEYHGYTNLEIKLGLKDVPLNLYGNDEVYKIMPDHKESIRPDGVVFAIRRERDGMSGLEAGSLFSRRALQEVDYTFDQCYIVPEGGEVVGIEVIDEIRRRKGVRGRRFTQVYDQIASYDSALRRYYADILKEKRRLDKEYGYKIQTSNELNRLCVQALGREDGKISLVERYDKVGVSIKLTIRYKVTPTVGWKLTDHFGGKGIVSMVIPDAQIPEGIDIVLSPNSTFNRNNPGRLFEGYFAQTARQLRAHILSYMNPKDPKTIDKAIKDIEDYYKLISPTLADAFINSSDRDKKKFILDLQTEEIRLHFTVTNTDNEEKVHKLQNSKFKLVKRSFRLPLPDGSSIESDPVAIINTMQVMLLSNLPTGQGVCNTPKVNNMGIPPSLSKQEKLRTPHRNSASKILAEPETKLLLAHVGPEVVAELRERVNNLETQYNYYTRILTAPNPTNIDKLRFKSERFTGGTVLNMFNGILRAGGSKLTYKKGK
jgi:hypothetical protein